MRCSERGVFYCMKHTITMIWAKHNIVKDKRYAPLKVKIYIKSSSGWILFICLHKMD